MENAYKILITDDDENISSIIDIYLKKEGYKTLLANNGEEAIEQFNKNPDINLIILDLMMPKIDGLDVLREVRKTSQLPVIILSAKGETFDKVLGLELGADDYIIKPFEPKELLARVKAVLRRYQESSINKSMLNANKNIIEHINLIIDLDKYEVTYNDDKISLPLKELELLYLLCSNPNRAFSREQILDKVWSYDYLGDTRTVDVHIKRLREKFPANDNWSIATVWGIGYKFQLG